MKELLKSVHICQSYRKSGTFFVAHGVQGWLLDECLCTWLSSHQILCVMKSAGLVYPFGWNHSIASDGTSDSALLMWCALYTVSQKKTSHFNFRHNFATCWDIFTIFEASCSGLNAGWCSLLHTYHWCEAFTWRDIIDDVIQAVARRAQWHCRFHTTWLMVSKLKT